jgi:glutathione peroxidase-family protein
MKKIFISLSFAMSAIAAMAQYNGEILDVKFHTIDSFRIDMNIYKGKTIVMVTIDASNPDKIQMRSLDSINKNSNNIAVIGLLANDFGNSKRRDSLLKVFRAQNGLSFPITNITKLKKNSVQDDRHKLIQWLDGHPKSKHFKAEFKEPGQIFIISKRGILYAVLSYNTILNGDRMNEILSGNPEN